MPLQQANFTVLDVFRPKTFFSPNHGVGFVKATGGEGMGGGGGGEAGEWGEGEGRKEGRRGWGKRKISNSIFKQKTAVDQSAWIKA